MRAKNKPEKNGRAESKAKEYERNLGDVALENRGVPFSVGATVNKGEQKLVELLSNRKI